MRKPKVILVYETFPKKGLLIIVNTSKKETVAVGLNQRTLLRNGVVIAPNFGSCSFSLRDLKKPVYAAAKGKASLVVMLVPDGKGNDICGQSFALND